MERREMKLPSDKTFETLLNGYGVKTDSDFIEVEKDVLISLARRMFMAGVNFEKGE